MVTGAARPLTRCGSDFPRVGDASRQRLLALQQLPTASVSSLERRCRGKKVKNSEEDKVTWLNYTQAASYCGWSVGHLRNLVSEGQVPVYGRSRVRRFRRDMLDLFLTNPDAAMRKFRLERNEHGS